MKYLKIILVVCLFALLVCLSGCGTVTPPPTSQPVTQPTTQPLPSTGSYNVKDYGAKGDGVTNDTQAIRSTINATPAGGTIYMPTGTYIIKAPAAQTWAILPLAEQNLKVCGDGVGRSTVKIADSCPTYKMIFGPPQGSSDNLSGLEVCGLTFDHNIANNPITNLAEVTDWGEYTVCVIIGSHIHYHDLEIKNASSLLNLTNQDFTNSSTDIVMENITCSNIGDDPNHISHDASFLEPQGPGPITVRNCHLTAAAPLSPGGTSAMEIDGTDITIENNTITNFRTGVLSYNNGNITNGTIEGNTITGTGTGVSLWSEGSSGYGINGLTISNNTVSVQPRGNNDSLFRAGIDVYYDSNLTVNDLTVSGNTVGCPSSITNCCGIGWPYTGGTPTLSNSSITGNTITNFGSSSIVWSNSVTRTNVTVSNNTEN